jgi:hypothetical protein
MGVTLPPQISVSGFPQRAMVTTSVTGTPSAGGVDSEAVACKWLPTQYEFRADLGTGVTRMEMYRRYIASCSACGLQNVLNPVSFAACIR